MGLVHSVNAAVRKRLFPTKRLEEEEDSMRPKNTKSIAPKIHKFLFIHYLI